MASIGRSAGFSRRKSAFSENSYLFNDSILKIDPYNRANGISYLSAVLYDEDEEPQNFRANTSSNAILDDFVNHSRFDASEKFETLLNGGMITEDVCEELTHDRIAESEKNLWSVMLMTGYVSRIYGTWYQGGGPKLRQVFSSANIYKKPICDV